MADEAASPVVGVPVAVPILYGVEVEVESPRSWFVRGPSIWHHVLQQQREEEEMAARLSALRATPVEGRRRQGWSAWSGRLR